MASTPPGSGNRVASNVTTEQQIEPAVVDVGVGHSAHQRTRGKDTGVPRQLRQQSVGLGGGDEITTVRTHALHPSDAPARPRPGGVGRGLPEPIGRFGSSAPYRKLAVVMTAGGS